MARTLFALLLCAASGCVSSAEPETISRAQFKQWFDEISNWGRWGQDDELGTLNLITPEVKAKAAALVKHGITVSLAFDLNKTKGEFNAHPFEQETTVLTVGSQTFIGDRYVVQYHGDVHTHIDGLAHVVHEGKLYNGFSADLIRRDGAQKLGIQNMHAGLFTRGVLVDMPWFRGVEFLEPGEAIRVADLEAWEVKTGITLRAGDALLVRTGRWQRARKVGPSRLVDGAPGLHASVAKWLKQRDVAVLGSDAGNDVLPSGVEGVLSPLHELTIAGLGMPLMDGLDLETLTTVALQHKRWEFLFVAAPLRVPGGTGAPLNPLAVF